MNTLDIAMRRSLAQLDLETRRWLKATETLCKKLVTKYAVPLALLHDSFEHSLIYNDFVYYCFTKSTKTLMAVNHLLDEGFGEDAQMLIRASYESYVSMAFLSAHPDRLDDLVAKKIGLKTGDFEHPVKPSGRKDYRKVIEKESGDILPFGLSISEMAGLTKYPEDPHVHRSLYRFLSEHCHTHMAASGNYRDNLNQRYVFESRHQVFQASIYAVYVYVITLSEHANFERHTKIHRTNLSRVVSDGLSLLQRAMDIVTFEDDLIELPKWLTARLLHCKPLINDT
jgi:Family of unknown function (DUF5677)